MLWKQRGGIWSRVDYRTSPFYNLNPNNVNNQIVPRWLTEKERGDREFQILYLNQNIVTGTRVVSWSHRSTVSIPVTGGHKDHHTLAASRIWLERMRSLCPPLPAAPPLFSFLEELGKKTACFLASRSENNRKRRLPKTARRKERVSFSFGFILPRFPVRNAKTKHRNFETNIPRKGISGSQSQFLHSCVCEWFIYIPTIGLPNLLEEICRPILGLCKSLIDTWMLKLGLRPRYSQKRNT